MSDAQPMKRSIDANRISLLEVLIPPLVLVRWRASFLQFQTRAIARQYRTNAFGFLWALMVPLITLAIYNFVFGTMFGNRRLDAVTATGAQIPFTLYLFAGLIVFWLMANTVADASNAIVNHTNLVKRAVFPLEIIPLTVVGTALFHTVINIAILLVAAIVMQQNIPITALLLPVVLVPWLLLLAGVAWFLAALGVFFREISHITGLLLTGMMFLSPVFYATNQLKPLYQTLIRFNPVSFVVVQVRATVLEGRMPSWWGLLEYTVIAWVITSLALLFFRQARKSFADVL